MLGTNQTNFNFGVVGLLLAAIPVFCVHYPSPTGFILAAFTGFTTAFGVITLLLWRSIPLDQLKLTLEDWKGDSNGEHNQFDLQGATKVLFQCGRGSKPLESHQL